MDTNPKQLNKTQLKFLRLGDYLCSRFRLSIGQKFKINDNYIFYRLEDSYFFIYRTISLRVSENSFYISLPNHIDITEFNPRILLRDLWKEAREYEIALEQAARQIRLVIKEIHESLVRACEKYEKAKKEDA